METTLVQWLSDPTVHRIGLALGCSVGVVVVFRILVHSLVRRVEDTDTRYRVRKIVGAIQYLTVLFVLAVVFKDRLGGLTVAFGVAGAGIAFALQEVIVSVAGWAAISFGSYFKVGDRIQLGSVVGDVIDVGILRTTLMECGQWVRGDLYNGRIVRVANSWVFKDPVVNYSADFAFLWDELNVPITLDSDLVVAREILDGILQKTVGDYAEQAEEAWQLMVAKYRIEAARVRPMVTMLFDENWAEFTLRYVVDFQRRRATKDLISSRILQAIADSGGRVRVAGATLGITELPPIDLSSAG